MAQDNKTSRRGFLKNILVGAAAFPILNNISVPGAEAQGAPTKPLSESDPMAKTMGYHHDATKVDKTKWPKKAAPDGDKQFCKTCILYLEGGKKIEGETSEFGKCGLFSNGLVNANGWCNSYVIKIGA